MPSTVGPILPYPAQLPQDYYTKNLPPPFAPVTPSALTPPIVVAPPAPGASVNNGGIYYGVSPPSNPQYGWLWTQGSGRLFIYTEPGIWSQVGTNW